MLCTVGKVALEKMESLSSKIRDNVATGTDILHHGFLREIFALASNRMSAEENESLAGSGNPLWVEKTSESHYPHIRLHGGALEDDPPRLTL